MNVRPAVLFDGSAPASKAMGEIAKTGTIVVITKGGKYFGVMDDRDVRQSSQDLSKTKCETLASRAPILSPDGSLLEVCTAFFGVRHKALPVVRAGKILGVATRSDVIAQLLAEGVLGKKKVYEIMSSPVLTVEMDTSIGKAKEIMRKENVRRLAVTEKGRLSGILSTFDLASSLGKPRGKESIMMDKSGLDTQPVSAFMRENVETISLTESLSDAAHRMVEHDVSGIIVSEGGIPKGIITARDIFETVISGSRESGQVFISGLEGGDKEYYPDIEEEGRRILEKLGKSFVVESLSLHIKKHGNRYAIRARLKSKEPVSVSAFAWTLPLALKQIKHEITRVISKKKVNRMHGRREKEI